MPSDPVQQLPSYVLQSADAASLRRSIERGVRTGALNPGDRLPSVRALAQELGLSPTTVASAYRELRQRGVLVSHDRARTVVAHHRELPARLAPTLPPGCRDLSSGNPDPALLVDLRSPLAALAPPQRRYGQERDEPLLTELAAQTMREDGVDPTHLAVVSSGLDGIERVLAVHCRAGDRVAVEDPGYVGSLDLLRSLGLETVGVGVDDDGPVPDALADALDLGVSALLVVPRAHNPTGAVLHAERAATLARLLDDHPEVVVIEDDHLAPLEEATLTSLTTGRARWAHVRSLSKAIDPDLRVAVLSGDEATITALQARQRLGPGWVSGMLQQLAARGWAQARQDGTLTLAARRYRARREALLHALRAHGLPAHGAAGLNVWVPVNEEVPVVAGLLARGWAVQAGEPFRISAEPGIRVTIAEMDEEEATRLAADLAAVLDDTLGTRRG